MSDSCTVVTYVLLTSFSYLSSMKFSYTWLQTYFEAPLPEPTELAELITAHSSEIEEVLPFGSDTVLNVKVLPDKSAWLLSHRGLAKELSVILKQPLSKDGLRHHNDTPLTLQPGRVMITLASPVCDYYSAAYITGVKVGPSPAWLREHLQAIGQRSINNIVDATNYVMFEFGQPLHAFAADKLQETSAGYAILVRPARPGESITTLTGEPYVLSADDTIIVDGVSDAPIGVAGIKGGQLAAVDETTTALMIESAHFNRQAIRLMSKRLKLATDASKRYENGISARVAKIALMEVVTLIKTIAGGEVVALTEAGALPPLPKPVTCSLTKLNSVLGVALTIGEVIAILDRFAYSYEVAGESFIVTPPFERDDLVLAEDLIEEIGRMSGLHNIVAVLPVAQPVTEYNPRFYYSEKIRTALVNRGFSEVYTSSFRAEDIVRLENALASDKGYLRSALAPNLSAARTANVPYRDLLGLPAILMFEIGTVFGASTEECRVALTVQTGSQYKAKVDEPLMTKALEAIAIALGVVPELITEENGVAEFSLDALLAQLSPVSTYDAPVVLPTVVYQAFSTYPASSRDVALWVEEETEVGAVAAILKAAAGPLCVRLTHLDTFTKNDKTSYAFRLVLQSFEHTLTEDVIQGLMAEVYQVIEKNGWEAR